MQVRVAQHEVRSVYLGGFAGQIVSGSIWLISAALGTWSSPRRAILVLVVGGAFIFPLTQLMLRVMGRAASLSPANPLRALAMQVAFTVPLSLPLVGAATMHHLNWFYPAIMVVVGAHYLPFIFLYGMWEFAIVASLLLGGGYALGLLVPDAFSLGGWLTGAVLILFAFVGRSSAARERGGVEPVA